MHFSVTKEVGWVADNEAEGPNPALGVKKRYRFSVDISRGSSKDKEGSDKTEAPLRPQLPEHPVKYSKHDDGGAPDMHVCYSCSKPRSDAYHAHRPLKPGKMPRPSLCTQCRYDRSMRITDSATPDLTGHGQGPKSPADVDERQWCVNCGTLRSNNYHDLYMSGNLPPWSEICHKCTIEAAKQGERERLRVYVEDLEEAASALARKEALDLAQDSICPRQSRPYSYTRPSSGEDETDVSPASSVATLSSGDSSGTEQPTPGFGRQAAVPANCPSAAAATGDPKLPRGEENLPPSAAPPQDSSPRGHRRQQREQSADQPALRSRRPHVSSPATPAPMPRPDEARQRQRQQPEQQAEQHQSPSQSQDRPQERPMGVSDMYWASEEGQAEQAFAATAAGGYDHGCGYDRAYGYGYGYGHGHGYWYGYAPAYDYGYGYGPGYDYSSFGFPAAASAAAADWYHYQSGLHQQDERGRERTAHAHAPAPARDRSRSSTRTRSSTSTTPPRPRPRPRPGTPSPRPRPPSPPPPPPPSPADSLRSFAGPPTPPPQYTSSASFFWGEDEEEQPMPAQWWWGSASGSGSHGFQMEAQMESETLDAHQRVWEVDSDEAEEIERQHARLVRGERGF